MAAGAQRRRRRLQGRTVVRDVVLGDVRGASAAVGKPAMFSDHLNRLAPAGNIGSGAIQASPGGALTRQNRRRGSRPARWAGGPCMTASSSTSSGPRGPSCLLRGAIMAAWNRWRGKGCCQRAGGGRGLAVPQGCLSRVCCLAGPAASFMDERQRDQPAQRERGFRRIRAAGTAHLAETWLPDRNAATPSGFAASELLEGLWEPNRSGASARAPCSPACDPSPAGGSAATCPRSFLAHSGVENTPGVEKSPGCLLSLARAAGAGEVGGLASCPTPPWLRRYGLHGISGAPCSAPVHVRAFF